tara:strand:- start:1356 stop:1655 length:300 start_codon:yes stop_codon:yes gene_type:complete
MFNTSLLDVLKENEKVRLEDSSIVVSIEDALGFVEKQGNINIFEQLRSKENLTQKEQSTIDLAEIYLPALARFKPGEIMEYLHADAQDIRDNKMKKGLL